MKDNIFIIEAEPANWKEAIKMTSEVLYENGFVKNTFYDMCVERELEFPTGLKTLLPVAIPHTNDSSVFDTAFCLLRLKKPVKFKNMEDSDQDIAIDFVLNMAVNGSAQLEALQNIVRIFQDEKFKEKAKTISLEDLKQLFEKNWNLNK